MKFFALFALAGLAVAVAAPAPQRPGQAAATTTTAAAQPSQDCFNRACGGGYPWKREEELAERAPEPVVEIVERTPEPVVEVIEARQRPGKAAPSAASSAAPQPSQDCFNRACGGGYPW